ncbi:hypothetical protein ACBQ54_10590 [Providencia vermicola]|uniref:hypothetical protein n=1 Tax=Providencia vermicola TaxID=333965 RepID=UPI003525EFC3
MDFIDNSSNRNKMLTSKYDCFLNGSEKELIYYLHFLQEDNKSCIYISNVDYRNINNVRKQIFNTLSKLNDNRVDVNDLIDEMIKSYNIETIAEYQFEWLKNNSRACHWLLLNLFSDRSEDSELDDVERENKLNLQSNSIYYSVIAWFDKIIFSRNDKIKNERLLKRYNKHWTDTIQNPSSAWFSKINNSAEIDYCFGYLKDSGMDVLRIAMRRRTIDFLIRLGERNLIAKKDIIIAFFDYLFSSRRSGAFAAENLKMKMASALSSWKNRKNKEGYVDVHFDIKEENIRKLEALKKRFNLMSKKDVVNALIEYMYDKKE